MASLPKWKAQLLERKRRDEEEGRRREKEELERLASIPAWKKEVMERRRSRLCSRPLPGEGQAPVPGRAGPRGDERAGTQEGAVLQEAIGPVNCNPFVRQERRRWDGEMGQGPRPRQWAPTNAGARTSRPGDLAAPEPEDLPHPWQPASDAPRADPGRRVGAPRRPVTEAALTRSVEDLSCLGRGQGKGEEEEGEEGEEGEQVPRRGRVSRLLSRFGQRRGFFARSRSSENVLRRPSRPGDPEIPGLLPRRPPQQPPSPSPPRSLPGASFVGRGDPTEDQDPEPPSPSPTPSPSSSPPATNARGEGAGCPPAHRPAEPEEGGRPTESPQASGRQVGAAPDPRETPAADGQGQGPGGPPPFPISHASRPEPPLGQAVVGDASPQPGSLSKPQPISTASPSCAGLTSGCLAAAASCPAAAATVSGGADDGPQDLQAGVGPERPPSPEQQAAQEGAGMSRLYRVEGLSLGRARAPPTAQEEAGPPVRFLKGAVGLLSRPEAAAPSEGPAEKDSPGTAPSDGQEAKGPWGCVRPSGTPQRKAGRTITINPRKMAASKASAAAENGVVAPPATTQPPAAPGAPAKKRYPTAEEILVIGGYLTLRRSCLVKAGATRRKRTVVIWKVLAAKQNRSEMYQEQFPKLSQINDKGKAPQGCSGRAKRQRGSTALSFQRASARRMGSCCTSSFNKNLQAQ